MAGDTIIRCERARECVSQRLDGELSELESHLLDRHLEQCEPCREWQRSVAGTTALLREAPLEHPSATVTVPVRRGGTRLRRTLLVAAVAVVAALASALGALLSTGGSDGPRPAPAPEFSFLERPGGGLGGRQQVTPPAPADEAEIPPEEPV